MSRPVLYVPGLPASHLFDTKTDRRIFLHLGRLNHPGLEGPDDLTDTEPIRAGRPIRRGARLLILDLAKQAEALYEILRKLGITPVPIGWDWRRPVWDDVFKDPDSKKPYSVRPRLRDAIRQQRQRSGKKVVLIVHSTGGLALRSLLEAEPELADSIELVLAFGVPWAGTPRPMELVNRQRGFLGIVGRARAQRVITKSWAAWDLFPPEPDFLFDEDGAPLMLTWREDAPGVRRQVSALTDRDWIASLPAELRQAAEKRASAAHGQLGLRKPQIEIGNRPLRVINIVGWGADTPIEAVLKGAGATATMTVLRGKQDSTLDGGDSTVPRRSAAWLRSGGQVSVTTYHTPIGRLPSTRNFPHNRLWSNPVGLALLRHHLGGATLGNLCFAALDKEDTVAQGPDEIRVRLVAQDPMGAILANARVRTKDLLGSQIEDPFDPRFAGRHLLRLPRARIRKVGSGLRRLELEIGWRENGTDLWQPRSFLLPA